MSLNAKDIKKADYNPRTISEEEQEGLSNSIKEFDDISGITFNSRTGNLVTGHQRWTELNAKKRQIELKRLDVEHEGSKAFYAIYDGKKNTGFILREVDWPSDKEIAANIAANSHALTGKYDTQKLGILIKKIDINLKNKLRMNKLELDLGLNVDWHSDMEQVEKTESNNDGIVAKIVITCNQDDRESLLMFIKGKIVETAFENVAVN